MNPTWFLSICMVIPSNNKNCESNGLYIPKNSCFTVSISVGSCGASPNPSIAAWS